MEVQQLSIKEIWELVEKKTAEDPSLITGLNAVYQFNIKTVDEIERYILRFDEQAHVTEGESEEADCILDMNEQNFKKLIEGTINSAAAFMTGKLKVKGNIGLALKLESALKNFS